MAQFYLSKINFVEVPSKKEFQKLLEIARVLDRDLFLPWQESILSPTIRWEWRNPSLKLVDLLNLLHCLGFPCEGKQLLLKDPGCKEFALWCEESGMIPPWEQERVDFENLPFTASCEKMTLHASDLKKVRQLTRRLDKYIY